MEERSSFAGSTAIQIIVDRFYREGDEPKPMTNRFLKNWDDRMPVWEFKEGDNNLNKFFYGGNLKGIESKLDYIASLGFDTICMAF